MERGGGEWESNPPRAVRPVGSFEDCEVHQDPCPSMPRPFGATRAPPSGCRGSGPLGANPVPASRPSPPGYEQRDGDGGDVVGRRDGKKRG
jgi:hypothetical protein